MAGIGINRKRREEQGVGRSTRPRNDSSTSTEDLTGEEDSSSQCFGTSSEEEEDTEEGLDEEEDEDLEKEDDNAAKYLSVGGAEYYIDPRARTHQREGLLAYARNVDTPRGKIVMACGTGKTLLCLWIAEAKLAALRHNDQSSRASHTILLLFPNLMLVQQTLREWAKSSRAGLGLSSDDGVERLVVCSDASCAERELDGADAEDDESASGMRSCERLCQVTTKAADIVSFLKSPSKGCAKAGAKVIFCTYQSAERIGEAQDLLAKEGHGEDGRIHLGLLDESHKTAGKRGTLSKVLFDDNVKIDQRISFTATPRNVRGSSNDSVTYISMDNTELYGDTLYHLSFQQAVKDYSIILPYRVLFIAVSDADGRHFTSSLADTVLASDGTDDSSDMTAKEAAIIAAIYKTMEEHRLRKGFTFHSRNKGAERFVACARKLLQLKEKPIDVDRIHGEMNSADRGKIMSRFKENPKKTILANARVLQEGVDVPAVELAVLVDPKYSHVDVAQMVGRVMRPAKNKVCGYVLVPIFVDRNDMADLQEEMGVNDTPRGEDGASDDCSDTESEVSTNEGDSGHASDDSEPSGDEEEKEEEEQPPPPHGNDDDSDAAESGDGASDVDATESSSGDDSAVEAVAEIIGDERSESDRGATEDEESSENGDDLRSDDDASDDEEQPDIPHRSAIGKYAAALAVLRALMQHDDYLEKHIRKIRSKMGELGRPMTWVEIQNDFPYFSESVDFKSLGGSISVDKLWDIIGTEVVTLASDGWDERYGELQAYKEVYGHSIVPKGWAKNKALATWVSTQREEKKKFHAGKDSQITEERIARLEEIGFVWAPQGAAWEQRFGELTAHKEEHGHCNVLNGCDENKALASWGSTQRKEKKKFHAGKDSQITEERIARLEEIGFVWDPQGAVWEQQFSELEAYNEEHGHCNVPNGWDEIKALASWVKTQRKEKKRFDAGEKAKITEERIARLDMIGFDWAPSKQSRV